MGDKPNGLQWHCASAPDSRVDRTQGPRNIAKSILSSSVFSSLSPLTNWLSNKPFNLLFLWSEVKVTQSCPTLCDPMDYIVLGILQTRILEWVAIPFSRGSSQSRDRTGVSLIAGRFFTSWATREAQEYWSAYPFSRGSYWPGNQTGVSCIAGGFFTNWAIKEYFIILVKIFGLAKKFIQGTSLMD